jgi:hypothetical protein
MREDEALLEVVRDELLLGVLAGSYDMQDVALGNHAGAGRLGIDYHRRAYVAQAHGRRSLAQAVARADRHDYFGHPFAYEHGHSRSPTSGSDDTSNDCRKDALRLPAPDMDLTPFVAAKP